MTVFSFQYLTLLFVLYLLCSFVLFFFKFTGDVKVSQNELVDSKMSSATLLKTLIKKLSHLVQVWLNIFIRRDLVLYDCVIGYTAIEVN